MHQSELMEVGLQMTALISHALSDTVPARGELEKMDLSRIFRLSRRHSVQACVYLALKKCVQVYGEEAVDRTLLRAFHNEYVRVMQELVRYDLAREEIYAFLTKQGCRYLPLKGIVLSEYYPALGMRQMSDNDILFEPSHAAALRRFMKEKGYKTVSFGQGCHDVYEKGGLAFEMHRALVSKKTRTPAAYTYYRDVWARLLPDGGMKMRFSPEELYVYFLSHAHKHVTGHGYGIRFLADTYVLLRYGEKTDRVCVDNALSRLSLTDFEALVRPLSEKLFSPEARSACAFTERERELLLYCFSSGTFGTYQTSVGNALSRMAKGGPITPMMRLRYFLSRIFPPLDYYRAKHPVLWRFIVTLPFLWAARLVRGLLFSRRRVGEELYHIRTSK